MIAKDTIFREYDIRGVVDGDFDSELAFQLGRAYGRMVLEQTEGADAPTVAVGRDCRLSGEALSARLIEGIQSRGINVVDSGMGPTPQLYYTVFARDLDGGIQVTGSHNPSDQNGFKMMVGKQTLSGASIQQLKDWIHKADDEQADTPGGIEVFDARSAYIAELVERLKPQLNSEKKLRVVVDAGNGVGGLVGPDVLRGIGCEVIELYTDPDGSFPNHHPDPTVLENIEEMRKRVVAEKADVGIAWDGDADRIGVVDEHGEPIFGDMLLTIYGRQLASEISQPVVIGDVKCSEKMFSDLRQHGVEAVMWKTGHSLIKSKLKELDAHLAGEMSGHMFFADRYYGFDDALYASGRLIEILSNTDKPVSELIADLPSSVSTPEIRYDCPEEIKFQVAELAKGQFSEYETNTLDGVRITFANGWGLVRASNTQPVLVLRFEADTAANLDNYRSLVEERIDRIIQNLSA